MIKFIDTHSHLNISDYDADRTEVIGRMEKAGVGAIAVGVDLKSSQSAVDLAKKQPSIFASVGLHPHDNLSELNTSFEYESYKALAQRPRVVAIGECGLDYSRLDNSEDKQAMILRQKEVFRLHIELAKELGKPLMLHIRPSKGTEDAYDAAYEVLKIAMQGGANDSLQNDLRGNVHFFAGSWPMAQKFLGLGFTLSFNGVITFARNYDEVIRNTPLDMILSETDCPFVTPIPFRGKRNEPSNVIYVVQKIAEIRGAATEKDRQEVVASLASNARRSFGLDF